MAHILFIDDDADTLETLSRAVGLFGHQASLARSGREGLERASSEHPDLIFLDLSLPDVSGLDLVRLLSDRTQVFVLSASPELDAAEQARLAGAQEYLAKPVRLQRLLSLIQEYAL